METTRLENILDTLTDIMSSGQGEGLTNWHKKTVVELFDVNKLTAEELKEVFEAFYNFGLDGVSIEELKWMMTICGVESFTIKP